MPDRRSVDDLSIEELERILAIKKREARQGQMRRMQRSGRIINQNPQPQADSTPASEKTAPVQSTPALSSKPQFEDAPDTGAFKRKNDDRRAWRRFVDGSLLLVEMGALAGLVFVVAAMLQSISMLQEETASAQQRADEQIRAAIPTIEPTPVLTLSNYVLPGGHTPPTSPGGAQFNFDEVPASLRSLIRDQVYVSPELERPPTTPETARRIVIPDINVDQVIVQGVDWEALKLGVGQVQNGDTPGVEGNVVLAAHNDIYGEIFRYLDDLEPGMRFEIHTERQVYNYEIRDKQIVNPDAVHVMDYQGFAGATLISCYPYQVSTERIVITAERLDL